MRSLLVLLAALILANAVKAQTHADPNEGTRLTYDGVLDSYELSWWGKAGRTYFFQQSDDLFSWEYLDKIESGGDDSLIWVFTSTTPQFFLRLRYSDIPTDNPFTADFDGDKVGNIYELWNGTDPLVSPDSDFDDLPDDWERWHFGNLNFGANDDADDDGLLNLGEFLHGTSPNSFDSDYDGLSDGDEVNVHHTDPLLWDTDGDLMPDGWEALHGLAVLVKDATGDADSDGLTNIEEYGYHTDPQLADTDGDGLTDGDELHLYFTHPLLPDTDGDGLSDGEEIAAGSDPNDSDSDNDGVSDGDEVDNGTDPNSDQEHPPVWRHISRDLDYDFYDYVQTYYEDTGHLGRSATWDSSLNDTEELTSAIPFSELGGRLDDLIFPGMPPPQNDTGLSSATAYGYVGAGPPRCPHADIRHQRYWLTVKPAPETAVERTIVIVTKRTIDGVAQEPEVRVHTATIAAGETRSEPLDIVPALGAANNETDEEVTETLQPVELVPDFNRDGVINDADRGKVTETDPWRFWINDDDDQGTTGGDDIPGQPPATIGADYLTYGGSFGDQGDVDGVRDLPDFFPLFLDIKKLVEVLPPGANAVYKLKHETGALNFVYTDLKPDGAESERAGAYLKNLSAAQQIGTKKTSHITASGVPLTSEFLNQIKDDGKGVILLEGRSRVTAADKKPLILEVSNAQGQKICEVKFHVAIDDVEKMFRHKNLLTAGGGSGGPADRLGEPPNYPDPLTSDKTFVMVHGYNVNAESARGWGAEMFKRLFWSGSKAKFYNVTWYGSETQIFGALTTDYQANVDNAFATAQQFASFLGGLSNVRVAGHSLGNMLVGSAIHDWGARPLQYFMIDAAVAKESYDDTEEQLTNGGAMGMEHPDWAPYDRRLWCSDWHLLPFAGGDSRSALTWENRLENVGDVTAYNFYSTGEEVLKNPSSPPSLPLSANEVWNKQERMKGRMLTGQVLSSNYGGWAFNSMWNITDTSDPENPTSRRRTPGETTEITNEQLKSNPFFSRGPGELYGANGSNYASPQQHRNTLLAEMVPALSFAAGSNPLTSFAPPGGGNRNYNMMEFKNNNAWPEERLQNDTNRDRWLHSDVKDVAYIYIHPLFTKLVELAELDQ